MQHPERIVSYAFPISHHFRVPFHERLRDILSANGITYKFIYSDYNNEHKNDTVNVEWAIKSKCLSMPIGRARLFYQFITTITRSHELVILQQENRQLSNIPVIIFRKLAGKKVAFFGHGQNFQGNANSVSEIIKRLMIKSVDWWFAYTERSADIVRRAGYPAHRITAFNNAIDTRAIQSEVAQVDIDEIARIRSNLCQGSEHVGVYIGGLYDLKRIDFLIEAALAVRQRVPDFHLLIIGGGPDRGAVENASQAHAWIHSLGPKFGKEKTTLACLGRVFLMPGLVGLSVLDSFAYGTPMVTTDVPYHSPEIDYLKDGDNGVIVSPHDDVDAYADAAARILTEDAWRNHLKTGATEALETYTIEAMAQRFAEGVMSAIST